MDNREYTQTPPNAVDAEIVYDRLMTEFIKLQKQFEAKGAEGAQSVMLGVTMFFGTTLSCVKEDAREIACHAAMGYAFHAHKFMRSQTRK